MNQIITIDDEAYEVDRTVAGAIHEAAEEIDTLRSVLRRLAVIVNGEPCWCNLDGFKHSKVCREARKLKIWPRRRNGKVVVTETVPIRRSIPPLLPRRRRLQEPQQ